MIEKAVRRFPSDGRIWAQAVEVWVTSNCGGQRKKKELKSSETARSNEEEEENIARAIATAQKLRGPSAVGLWLRLIDYYSSAGKTAAATRKVFEVRENGKIAEEVTTVLTYDGRCLRLHLLSFEFGWGAAVA